MKNPIEHFAPLLDADLMATRLQEHLPECVAGQWLITGCDIQHPRYKSYLSAENYDFAFLSLVYHLNGKQPASTTTENRILFARAYLGDQSSQAFAAVQDFVDPQADEDQVIHLVELGMVVWRFPADPGIARLADLVDMKQVTTLIPKQLSNGDELTEIEIINYRPEVRCTARYGFRSANAPAQYNLYGKIYADLTGQIISANLSALSTQSQHADAFVIPTSLGYDADRHILWMQGLEGLPIKNLLFGINPQPLIDRITRALAAFQQISLPQLTSISHEKNLREWQKKARKLAHSYAELGDELKSLVNVLENNCVESVTKGLLHGDFHIEQLALLSSGRIALFDFDELAYGDSLQDLANFAADLYNHKLPTDQTDSLVDKLLNAYRLASNGQVSPKRFYWHLCGQLLTRAYRAHIQQRPDTSRQVTRFILLANRFSNEHFELSSRNTDHEPC